MDAKYSINRASLFTKLKRRIRRIFIEWWNGEYVVNHKSSFLFLKMLRVISRGRDKDGNRINLWKFNSLSARTFWNLYKEIKGLDVILVYNPKTERVERHAQKVTVLIKNVAEGYMWLEVERRYPNGEVRVKQQEFTIRETRKRGQTSLDAAKKGMKQELGYYPHESEIEAPEAFDRPDIHESSVYYGLVSCDIVIPFIVNSKNFHRKDGHVIKDYGDSPASNDNNWVEATIKRFPLAA